MFHLLLQEEESLPVSLSLSVTFLIRQTIHYYEFDLLISIDFLIILFNVREFTLQPAIIFLIINRNRNIHSSNKKVLLLIKIIHANNRILII